MREFIVKYFGRVLAVLGCSTLVTACYGVPPMDFEVRGTVADAQTGEPVEGIMVRAFMRGIDGYDGDVPKYSIVTSETTESASDGSFRMTLMEDYYPDDFLIEWQDLDGPENGEYASGTMTALPDNTENININLIKINH